MKLPRVQTMEKATENTSSFLSLREGSMSKGKWSTHLLLEMQSSSSGINYWVGCPRNWFQACCRQKRRVELNLLLCIHPNTGLSSRRRVSSRKVDEIGVLRSIV